MAKIYDRVYTIGCFDWFHYGHERLLQRLKKRGKFLIVGIHDDDSLEKLKNLNPTDHQDIKTRMVNVKKYADIVYVVPDKDPTFYLNCSMSSTDKKKCLLYESG
jgi:cytidyltransferase-like protein